MTTSLLPDPPDGALGARVFGSARSEAVVGLRATFERSRRPMLIADDQRRWVTGNRAACQLLGVAREEVAWRTMDDFTPASERRRLEKEWEAFLSRGAAEGRYELYVPDRGLVPTEFGAIANVLVSRHLAVFMPPETSARSPKKSAGEAAWAAVVAKDHGRVALTKREREVITLIAAGSQNDAIADQLFVSSETVKSHVQNALGKLGARTRAHAVAVALVTGQIVGPEL